MVTRNIDFVYVDQEAKQEVRSLDVICKVNLVIFTSGDSEKALGEEIKTVFIEPNNVVVHYFMIPKERDLQLCEEDHIIDGIDISKKVLFIRHSRSVCTA